MEYVFNKTQRDDVTNADLYLHFLVTLFGAEIKRSDNLTFLLFSN
jgi:hypothetical protein